MPHRYCAARTGRCRAAGWRRAVVPCRGTAVSRRQPDHMPPHTSNSAPTCTPLRARSSACLPPGRQGRSRAHPAARGFAPVARTGLAGSAGGGEAAQPLPARVGRVHRLRRVRDWLQLLGFETEQQAPGCWRPRCGTERWRCSAQAWRSTAGDPARLPLRPARLPGRGQTGARHAPARADLNHAAGRKAVGRPRHPCPRNRGILSPSTPTAPVRQPLALAAGVPLRPAWQKRTRRRTRHHQQPLELTAVIQGLSAQAPLPRQPHLDSQYTCAASPNGMPGWKARAAGRPPQRNRSRTRTSGSSSTISFRAGATRSSGIRVRGPRRRPRQ